VIERNIGPVIFTLVAALCIAAPALAGEKPLPFNVPSKLSNGEFLFFQAANSVSSFPYSDGTIINVYTYSDTEAAAKDFGAIDNVSVAVSVETNTVLSRIGARTFTAGERKFLAFLMGESLLAISYLGSKLTTAEALKTGEQIFIDAREKMKKLFADPEAAFKTFCGAIETGNEPMMFTSLASPIPDEFRMRIGGRMESIISFSSRRRQGPRFVLAETEKLDNDTVNCRMVEDVPNLWNSPWFRVVREGLIELQLSQYASTDEYWIPFRKQDGLWKIDIAMIKRKAIMRTENEFKAAKELQDCQRNFQQISYALRNWRNRNRNNRLPENPKDILASRGGSAKLVCPGAESQGIAYDINNSNLLYFPYPTATDELPANALIFCDREGAHPHPEPKRVLLSLDYRVEIVSEEVALTRIAEAKQLCRGTKINEIEQPPEENLEPLAPEEEKILRALIKQLGDNSWEVREKAQEALINFGRRAMPIIMEAKDSTDDEIKWRVGRILKAYLEQKNRK
jgi:hypothetical protein